MVSVKDTLAKYNYAELTHNQIAIEMGFDENEQKMLNIFWQPAFNKGWIYLSDKFIKEDMGYKKISDFYCDTLRKKYVENTDYKEITKNHDLVKIYESINADQSALCKKHKRGKEKKYYAVTGETLKKLLMRCGTKKGDQVCDYYLKVEQLAIFMKEYINALHSHILETKIAEKDKEISEQKENVNRIHNVNKELLSYKKLNEKNETVYIVSSHNYAKQGIYKIGRTTNMKARTSGHNTTRISGDKTKVLRQYKVNNSKLIERNIHMKLNGLLLKDSKEFFLCPFDLIENLVECIINNDDTQNKLLNSIVDTVNALQIAKYKPEQWMRGIEDDVFKDEMKLIIQNDEGKIETQATFDVSGATEIQRKEFVAHCIESYKKTIADPQRILWKAFQTYLISQLNIPKYKYKSLTWKPLFVEQKNKSE
jgi:hypothetical protein